MLTKSFFGLFFVFFTSTSFGANVTATWDGSAGTDWNTAANWDINVVPNNGNGGNDYNVIIPTGLSNYPDIGTNSFAIRGINSMESGTSISGSAGVLTLSTVNTTTITGTATISCKLNSTIVTTFSPTNDSDQLIISGIYSGAAGGVTKSGDGVLVLSGLNTFTGAVTINAGILSVNTVANASAPSAIGTGAATPTITIGGSGTFKYTGAALTSSRAIIITGSGATIDASGTGLLTLSGSITGATFGLVLTGTGTCTMSGVIGNSTGSVTKNGTSTFTLSGNNTYTGATIINNGTLKSGRATVSFGVNSAVTMANVANAIMDISSFATTIGSLTGGGTTGGNIILGAVILTIGGDNSSPAAYAGIISGTGGITKSGSGTLILGGLNTYTGATLISGGILKLGISSSLATEGPLGAASAGTTVGNGFTLDLNDFSLTAAAAEPLTITGTGISTMGALTNTGSDTSIYEGDITLAAAATIESTASGTLVLNGDISTSLVLTLRGLGVGVFAGVRSGSSTIVKNDNGTWILAGNNSHTGATTITAGTIKLGATGDGTNSPLGTTAAATTIASGGSLDLNGYTLSTLEAISSVAGTGVSGSGAITNTGGNATFNGAITLTTAPTFLATTSGSMTLTGAVTSNQPLTLSGSGNGFLSGTRTGNGSATLIKTGTGKWTLSGSKVFTGAVTITTGILSTNLVANGGTSSPIGAGTNINIDAAGTLEYTGIGHSSARPIVLIGSGATIDASGSGTLTLAGGVIGSTFGLVLTGTGNGNLTTAAIGTGTGTLTKNGSGTWTMTFANTYTGLTTITAGSLNYGVSNAINTGAITINGATAILNLGIFNESAGIITLDGGGAIASSSGILSSTGTFELKKGTVSAILAGSAVSLNKTTTDTVTLSGTNTFTGEVTIGSGLLSVNTVANAASPSALGAGTTITIGATGTLHYTGNGNSTARAIVLSGTGATIDASGSGALTLSGGVTGNTFGLVLTGTGSGALTTSAIATTSGALTKNGSGTWTLSATNSYTGGTNLTNGTLNINSTSALGTSGTFAITGGSIDNTSGADISTNNYSIAINGNFTYTGSVPRNLNFGTGTVTMNGNSQVTVTAGTLTIGGVLNDNTKSLTKAGAGTLSFGSQAVTLNDVSISGGTLVSTSGTLGILGALSNSGTFTHNGGTVNFNKSGAQNIAGLTYNNLTCSNTGTKTASDSVFVKGTLTVTGATFNGIGKLKLLSDSLGTARVAANTSGATYIIGNVIAERFIPSKSLRRWRFCGAPISGRTMADLQDDIFITGTGGAANGFDATLSNQSSVYSYNEAATGDLNSGWTACTNTGDAITLGKGYRIFIRGDRDTGRLNGTITDQNAVTIDLVGALNQGDIIMPVTYSVANGAANDGWNLVANPYASAISWNAVHDAGRVSDTMNGTSYTNIRPTIYIFDATTNSYTSYNAVSDVGTGSLGAVASRGIIPAGAAFWVQAVGAPSLTIKEIHKIDSLPAAVFKTASGHFSVKLIQDSITSDEAAFKYVPGTSGGLDGYDIPKLYGSDVNIASIGTDGSFLSANCKPFNGHSDTIMLSLGFAKSGQYKLEFHNLAGLGLVSGNDVYVIDRFKQQTIDVSESDSYTFTVDKNDTATFGNARFMLVVGDVNTAMPEFNATSKDKKMYLYPSATSGSTTVYSPKTFSSNSKIRITDLGGKNIASFNNIEWMNNKVELDFSTYQSGIYFITIEDNGNIVQTLKCIKQ